jgi:hypothetical protein
VDTRDHPNIRKPAYATPINKWHIPRKVQKARPTFAKILSEKSEKINKQLKNYFNPLAEPNDDSEHPMPDATEQNWKVLSIHIIHLSLSYP